MENEDRFQKRIDTTLEDLLSEIYSDEKIESGDIAPEQLRKWENLTEEFAALFSELVELNK